MAGYTRQSTADIMAGEVVRAAPLNTEFDALQAAFNGTTGHAHDGSTGNGPRINLTTSVSNQLPVINGGTGVQTYEDLVLALELEPGVDVQAYDADLAAIAALAGTGIAVRTGAGTWGQRNIVGTPAEVTVTFGDTIGGNPTISLPAALTFTGKTVTGGTYTGGTFSGVGTGLTSLTAANLTGTISDSVHGARGGGTLHSNATTAVAGFMSAADKLALDNLAGQTALPSGMIMMWPSTTVPTGFLECNGAAVSRTTYAGIFAVTGTAYGPGNGSTTFNLPDFRGQFARGWDNGRGVDVGRAIGTTQADAFREHTHTGTAMSGGSHSHTASAASTSISQTFTTSSDSHNHTGTTASSGSHTHSGTANSAGAHNHDVAALTTRFIEGAGTGLTTGNGTKSSTDGAHTHSLSINADGAHTHTFTTSTDSHSHTGTTNASSHTHTITVNAGGTHTHTLSVDETGGVETRPTNVSVMYIIKT